MAIRKTCRGSWYQCLATYRVAMHLFSSMCLTVPRSSFSILADGVSAYANRSFSCFPARPLQSFNPAHIPRPGARPGSISGDARE